MWIFTPTSFISIIQKPGQTDTLTVRARIEGDIEAVFPNATVVANGGTDYKYRAVLPRDEVAKAVADQVMAVNYSDFKSAIKDANRHAAVMNVWAAMYLWRANAIPAGVGARIKRARK